MDDQIHAEFIALCSLSSSAWQRLAESKPAGSVEELFDAPDPITFARLAWRGLHDPACGETYRRRLGVYFTEALEQSHRAPLGFAHAVIEGARQKCFHTNNNPAWMKETQKLVFEAELAAITFERWYNLLVLVAIYQADELSAAGQRSLAADLVKSLIWLAPLLHPDIGFRIAEVGSKIALNGNRPREAHECQDVAERLATDANVSAGCQAILLEHRARLFAHGGDHQTALRTLELARSRIEQAARDDRMRLEILHRQFHFLTLLGKDAEAETLLPEYAELMDSAVGDRCLKSEKRVFLGRLRLRQGRYEEAITAMAKAAFELFVFKQFDHALLALKETKAAMETCERAGVELPDLFAHELCHAVSVENASPE